MIEAGSLDDGAAVVAAAAIAGRHRSRRPVVYHPMTDHLLDHRHHHRWRSVGIPFAGADGAAVRLIAAVGTRRRRNRCTADRRTRAHTSCSAHRRRHRFVSAVVIVIVAAGRTAATTSSVRHAAWWPPYLDAIAGGTAHRHAPMRWTTFVSPA